MFLGGSGDGFDFGGERVHARVAMLPGIDEQPLVEGINDSLNIGQFEKARLGGNQQANGKLNGGDVLDEAEFRKRFEQVAIAFERSPRREGHEGWLQRESEFTEGPRDVKKIGARVALFELAKDFVVEGFDGAGDEEAIGIPEDRQVTFVDAEMLDFDGDVVRKLRKFRVQIADDRERVADAIEKIGIAEGDVPGARGDLLADIGENRLFFHDAENAIVHGDDRAMAAAMFAAAASFGVAGDAVTAVRQDDAGVAREGGKTGAVRGEELLAAEGNGGWRGRCAREVKAGAQAGLDAGRIAGAAGSERIRESGERLLELSAEEVADAELAEALFGQRGIEPINAEFRGGIEGAQSGDEREGKAGGCVHGDKAGDEAGVADGGLAEFLAGEVEGGDLMAAVAEPSGGRSKAEGLVAQFVGGDQEYVHELSIAPWRDLPAYEART